MPIPVTTIPEMDDQTSPLSESHHHLGGTSSAPAVPTLHDRTRGMTDFGGGTNPYSQLLGRASTRLAQSFQGVGFHNRYSAHVLDRALTEGSSRFAGPSLLGRSTHRGVNTPSAGSGINSEPSRHGVYGISQGDVSRTLLSTLDMKF